MIALTLKVDDSGLQVLRGDQLARLVVSVASKAGGDAIRAMRTDSSRRVRERKSIKLAGVNKAMTIIYPSQKEASQLRWVLDISGEVMPVASYPHRQVKRGVSVAINKGGRALIRGAFVATMRSGHEGVFRRQTKGGPRLPIKELFTTRVVDVLLDQGAIEEIQDRAAKVFGATWARLLPVELAKLRGR